MQRSQLDPSIPTGAEAGQLEPGLLSVLRVILVLQIMVQSISAITGLVQRPLAPPVNSLWLILLPLLVLAFWPRLSVRMGRWFLPLVVLYYAIAVIAYQAVFFDWALQQPVLRQYFATSSSPMGLNDSGWALFVILLIPLVLVAWQYDFTRVVAFSLFVALLEGVAAGLILQVNGLPPLPMALTGLGHAGVFLLIGYIVTRMMNAQRAQRRELAAYTATLEQLTVSHERNRMARELHDTLAHSLSAVSVQLEAADSALDDSPTTTRTLITKALAQTRSGLTETRRAMQALRASPLEDLGLGLAIRNLAESTARRGGMAADIQIAEPLPALPPAVEQGVFRVVQEVLSNVARHAGATHLYVQLEANGELILTVRDNGRGFDAEATGVNGHFGLQGMRERAEMMGATLKVQSAAATGTTVRLVVP
jgi:signal transduction histidine kinase